MTLEQVIAAKLTLNEVESKWRYGTISDEVVNAYLELWNATPGRFTVAVLRDGAIRNSIILA